MKLINIADIKNPETGKTFREENESKVHNIPIGALVEVDFDDSCSDRPLKGLRLFVVAHNRDCDGTPLYSLSFNKNWNPNMYGEQYKLFTTFSIDSGYSEESLKIIAI